MELAMPYMEIPHTNGLLNEIIYTFSLEQSYLLLMPMKLIFIHRSFIGNFYLIILIQIIYEQHTNTSGSTGYIQQ